MNTAHERDAIVAGADGSPAALQAVRWAAVEARNYSCPLRLVHTLQWPLVGYPIPPGLRADWTNEIHEQGCAWLWQAEKAANLIAPEVRVEVHLLAGDPRQCLLTDAESARELMSPIPRKSYSKQTQRQVDQEVARLLGEAEDRAVSLLKRHRAALDRLASVLMDQETVDGGAVLNSLRDEPAPDTEGRGDFIPAAPRGK